MPVRTGSAGTSTRAISAAARTSPENVYLVFGTKAAPLGAWIDAARRQDVAISSGVVPGEVPARRDMDRAPILDLVSALLSVHLYRALVLTAVWTTRRYERECFGRSDPPCRPTPRCATKDDAAP